MLRGMHRHRDLYIVLGPTLLVVFGGLLGSVPAARIGGAWAVALLLVGSVSVVLGLYIAAALIWTWPLPGGLAGTVVGNETDEQLGRECLSLAQAMTDIIAEAKLGEPPYTFSPPGTDQAESFRQWQEASGRRQAHEKQVLARFLERFAVRFASVLQALNARGALTVEEQRSLWWALSVPTIHGLDRLPAALAQKARDLSVKP